jgi:hypothetical protein
MSLPIKYSNIAWVISNSNPPSLISQLLQYSMVSPYHLLGFCAYRYWDSGALIDGNPRWFIDDNPFSPNID